MSYLRWLLASLLVVLAAAPAWGQALDESIELGDRFRGVIISPADQDMVRFPAVATTRLTVKLVGKEGLRPAVALLDLSTGLVVPISSYVRGLGTSTVKIAGAPLPSTARYDLLISSFDGSTGRYKLKVTGSVPRRTRKFNVSRWTHPGETVEVEFDARVGSKLNVVFKPAGNSGAVVQLQTLTLPDGAEMSLAPYAQYQGRKIIIKKAPLPQLGVYRLTVLNNRYSGRPGRIRSRGSIKQPGAQNRTWWERSDEIRVTGAERHTVTPGTFQLPLVGSASNGEPVIFRLLNVTPPATGPGLTGVTISPDGLVRAVVPPGFVGPADINLEAGNAAGTLIAQATASLEGPLTAYLVTGQTDSADGSLDTLINPPGTFADVELSAEPGFMPPGWSVEVGLFVTDAGSGSGAQRLGVRALAPPSGDALLTLPATLFADGMVPEALDRVMVSPMDGRMWIMVPTTLGVGSDSLTITVPPQAFGAVTFAGSGAAEWACLVNLLDHGGSGLASSDGSQSEDSTATPTAFVLLKRNPSGLIENLGKIVLDNGAVTGGGGLDLDDLPSVLSGLDKLAILFPGYNFLSLSGMTNEAWYSSSEPESLTDWLLDIDRYDAVLVATYNTWASMDNEWQVHSSDQLGIISNFDMLLQGIGPALSAEQRIIDVIGHSQGGLVARDLLMTNLAFRGFTRSFVTLATPHGGAISLDPLILLLHLMCGTYPHLFCPPPPLDNNDGMDDISLGLFGGLPDYLSNLNSRPAWAELLDSDVRCFALGADNDRIVFDDHAVPGEYLHNRLWLRGFGFLKAHSQIHEVDRAEPLTVFSGSGHPDEPPWNGTNLGQFTLAQVVTSVLGTADLVATSVTVSPTRVNVNETGHVIDVSVAVENMGVGTSEGQSTVRVYVSEDATISDSDRVLATLPLDQLGAGGADLLTTSVPVPSDIACTSYHYGAIVDVLDQVKEGLGEANNATPSFGQVTFEGCDERPNLVVESVSVSPPSVNVHTTGNPISVQVIVRNDGSLPSQGSFDTCVYLSTNSSIAPSDKLLNMFTFSGGTLDPGARAVFTGTAEVPAGIECRLYFSGAIVDVNDAIDEGSDEGDNTRTGNGRIDFQGCDDRPNLVVQSVSISPHTVNVNTTGNPISVQVTVQNIGPLAAQGSFNTSVYLSLDGTITQADVLVTTLAFSGGTLAPGASTTLSGSASVPGGVQCQSYFHGAIVDVHNSIDEGNDEGDNITLGSGQITFVGCNDRPNLVVQSVSVSPHSMDINTPGSPLTVSVVVQNVGTLPATGSFDTRVYLSTDATIDTGDILLRSLMFSGGSLSPGATVTLAGTAPVPSGLQCQSYDYGAVTDVGNSIDEGNDEGDNVTRGSGRITFTGCTTPEPDLIITDIDVSPHSIDASTSGTPLSVTVRVKNVGTLATSGVFSSKVYLNASSSFPNSNDILLATLTFPASIAVGHTSVRTANVAIPSWIYQHCPQTLFYGGEVDVYGQISESDENNNLWNPLANDKVTFSCPAGPGYVDIEAAENATVGSNNRNATAPPLFGSNTTYLGLGYETGGTTGVNWGHMFTLIRWDLSSSALANAGLPSGATVTNVELVWRKGQWDTSLANKTVSCEPIAQSWSPYNVTYNTIPNTDNSVNANFTFGSQSTITQDITNIWTHWQGRPNFGLMFWIYTAGKEALMYSRDASNKPTLRIWYR